jgi:opacity protein-like surface antigen
MHRRKFQKIRRFLDLHSREGARFFFRPAASKIVSLPMSKNFRPRALQSSFSQARTCSHNKGFGNGGVPGFGSYCLETPFAFPGHNSSATGGAFLGYRAQVGWWVIGAEIDANYKSGSSSASLSDANLFRSESFYGTMKQTGNASLRLRAGVLVTPWTLLYATGGAAVGDISGSFGYTAHERPTAFGCGGVPTTCASVTGGQSWSDARTGWTAGGSIEYLVLPNVTLRVEYRYTDYGFYQKYVPLSTHNCSFVNAGAGCTAPTSNAVIDLHPTLRCSGEPIPAGDAG